MSIKPVRMYSWLVLAALLPAASLGADIASTAPPVQAQRLVSLREAAIEGVWDSTVTLTPCQNSSIVLARFRALNQFSRHGSLIATSQVAQPPSLGRWQWLGGRSYRASFRLQRFGAGGVFEGLTQVTRVIQLAADGRSFSGVVATELFDLSDTVFMKGCGLETATRIY